MWLSTVDSSRCFHPSNLEYHLQCKCAQYRGLAMSRQLRDAREQGRGRGGGATGRTWETQTELDSGHPDPFLRHCANGAWPKKVAQCLVGQILNYKPGGDWRREKIWRESAPHGYKIGLTKVIKRLRTITKTTTTQPLEPWLSPPQHNHWNHDYHHHNIISINYKNILESLPQTPPV